jgi:ABC-type transport system involved in multi-copper enzyme maturation permease subunit
MSAGTVTPVRPAGAAGAGRFGFLNGFAPLLRAEWIKFRSVRGWVIGMVVAVGVMEFMGLFLAQQHVDCQVSGGPAKSGAACVQPLTLGPGGVPVDDSYYFVRRAMGSHGSLTVRLTSLTGRWGGGNGPVSSGDPLAGLQPGLQPWSKAGILITGSTKPGAAYAAIMATGRHGVAMQYDYTSSVAGRPGAVGPTSPRWLRLVRSGDTISGYDSADGAHWTLVGTAHLAGLPATVQAGMFATSPAYQHVTQYVGHSQGQVGPSLATGVFDHTRLVGSPEGVAGPGGAWTGVNVGDNEPYGPGTGQVETFHQAGGRFTVTGSGDIAPVVNGLGSGPTSTISQHLIGTFAGLIAVAVVAVMFMTAEYRRGLIRVTLAASPRRGRVLAAKAVVIGAVAFAAGLVAAAIAVPIGAHIDHVNGLQVFPAPWLTAVQVIAGTGLLLAVMAAFALAVGTMVRRSAVAVTAVIVGIVVPYFLGVAQVLPTGASEWLMRVTPAAGFSIQQSLMVYPQVTNSYTVPNGYYPLGPWGGFAVLCGWALVAMAGAVYLLRRRDA